MHILGIACHYHDAAAAILEDGELVAAAQEERFSRRKHDPSFPSRAIRFCLDRAAIPASGLDYAVFYEKPLRKFERILRTHLHTYPGSRQSFGEAMTQWFDEKLWIKSRIQEELGLDPEQVLFTEHHLSHAASSFFCSPFEEAAILTVDGVGEWTTTALGRARADWDGGGGNTIELFEELRFPHSLGLLYSTFTAWLGFRVNNGEYKVMGMASYGEPRYLDRVERIARLQDDGSLLLDLDYFDFHRSLDRSYNRRFLDLFGPPRAPGEDFVTRQVDPNAELPSSALEQNQHYADVAASVQRFTEDALLRMARRLKDRTGLDTLCLAGGVCLNSVANGRLMREGPFRDLYIQPAAGDAGGAVGAALYAWHVMLGRPRSYVMDSPFLGQEYGPHETRQVLERSGARYREPGEDELRERVVEALTSGKVVALHQGRFEWGPRALGNRSILADPRSGQMKDLVNRKIKYREPFRPFAPALPAEAAADYFPDADHASRGSGTPPSPRPTDFMLAVLPWRKELGRHFPAVNHQGTGRLQTVRRSVNPRYYDVISAFGDRTGHPVLLNTSFNLRGEPIVSDPASALRTFRESGIDLLVIGRWLVEAE